MPIQFPRETNTLKSFCKSKSREISFTNICFRPSNVKVRIPYISLLRKSHLYPTFAFCIVNSQSQFSKASK